MTTEPSGDNGVRAGGSGEGEAVGRFQTTHWSLIRSYQDATDAPSERRRLLETLARVYHAPVRAYFVRSGAPADVADDLTQSFFTEVVVGRALLDSARESKGRLRSLLLRSLKNFLIDHRRRDTRQRRLVEGAAHNDLPGDSDFDCDFARSILSESLRRCEQHYRSSRRDAHWEAFEQRVLLPIASGITRPTLRQVSDQLQFRSASAAAAAVEVVRARLRTTYRSLVAETVTTETDAEDEFGYLDALMRGAPSTGTAAGKTGSEETRG